MHPVICSPSHRIYCGCIAERCGTLVFDARPKSNHARRIMFSSHHTSVRRCTSACTCCVGTFCTKYCCPNHCELVHPESPRGSFLSEQQGRNFTTHLRHMARLTGIVGARCPDPIPWWQIQSSCRLDPVTWPWWMPIPVFACNLP